MNQSLIQIDTLQPKDLNAAVTIIAESFRHEGFTRTMWNLSTPEQRQRFVDAGTLRLLLSLNTGQQVLVATHDATVAGVAIVKPPAAKPTLPWYRLAGMIIRRVPRLSKVLLDFRWRRMAQMIPAMKLAAKLPQPYYTLDILGVSPDFQGQGIGRHLLDQIHAQCDQDEQASGIYLYTGDEKNVHIYQRFGYEVLEKKQAGTLTVWHMFRPHPARAAEMRLAQPQTEAMQKSPAPWRQAALPILGMVGVFVTLALLWRLLRPHD